MLYYAVETHGLCGGVMITASHNPGRYNGMKICREHAIPIGGDTGLAGHRGARRRHLGPPRT